MSGGKAAKGDGRSVAATWGEREAQRALAEGRPIAEVLRVGLPWATELLKGKALRGLDAGEREDVVQDAWLDANACLEEEPEATDWNGSIAAWPLEYIRATIASLASQYRARRRRAARRGRAWEEARGRGSNGWP